MSKKKGWSIGYRKGSRGGYWIAKHYSREHGRRIKRIGVADDVPGVTGIDILDYEAAEERSREWFKELAETDAREHVSSGSYTVADAIKDYMAEYEGRGGKYGKDKQVQIDAFILPKFGKKETGDLTTSDIRKWHRDLSKIPPRLRFGKGKAVRHRDTSNDPDAERKRRYRANKILVILKAVLNYAWQEGKVASDDKWRRVKPFPGVDAARVRYLAQAECARLINACGPDLRLLVQAALFTGCRYGELAAAKVNDFDPDRGTLFIGKSKSKSGKARHVVLTDEGRKFFERAAAGKSGDQTMFLRGNGGPWGKSHQTRPLAAACDAASIAPRVSFHILRHSYASHLVMNGVPLGVVSKNLGHADTRMTERHYAHLASSYIADEIRAGAPELGILSEDNVTPLPVGGGGG